MRMRQQVYQPTGTHFLTYRHTIPSSYVKMIIRLSKLVLLTMVVISLVHGAPAPTKKTPAPPPEGGVEDPNPDQSTGLYYDQYLQTVVKLLESDENFRKNIESANFDDIKSGKLSGELYKIPTEIRQKLDVVKKNEISRLRKILRAKMDVEKGKKIANSGYLKQIANHLDSSNPHSFEAQDLTNLIKAATNDLESFDAERHEEFKRYEMTKQLRRQEKFRQLNEEERKKAEGEYKEMRQKHENHPDVNHPGSKAQLDEVWKEKDGLIDEIFDPKTFFIMHDINGDGALDPMELEALFEKELAKVYDFANPEDDMVEMEEERVRMRQHVMNEVDKDGNGLLTMDEFLKYSQTSEFEKPDENSYKSVDEIIDQGDLYTKDELEKFRQMIAEQEEDLQQRLDDLNNQARAVADMKSDVQRQAQQMGENPEEHEKANFKEKKEEMEEEEKLLQNMHEDVKEQSEEIIGMKNELKKQEQAVKLTEEQPDGNAAEVQDIPDNLVPGIAELVNPPDKQVEPQHMEKQVADQ